MKGYWFGLAAIASVMTWLSWSFLEGPPVSDSWMAIWSLRELSLWDVMTDPLSAGYAYIPMFEPLFVLAHAPGVALAPFLGNPAHHLLGLAGILLTAERLAWLVRSATGSTAIALSMAALFLALPTTWFAVAETTHCPYALATWLALCSVSAPFRTYVTGHRPKALAVVLSVLAYALGLGCKPSVAAIPLLAFCLLVAAGWRSIAAAAFVVPHAIVLLLVTAWQGYIMGGNGGYAFAPNLVFSNLMVAPLVWSWIAWGNASVGPALAAAVVLLRPKLTWLLVVITIVSIGPFVLTYPFGFNAYAATKLLLLQALLPLALGLSGKRVGNGVVVLVTALLVVVGWSRHWLPRVYIDDTVREETEYRTTREGLAVLSPRAIFIAYIWGHQLEPEPKGPLLAFFTPEDVQLFRAVEGEIPSDARKIGISEPAPPVVTPLPLDGIQLGADAYGHFHVEFTKDVPAGIRQGFLYENGKTRALYSWPPLVRRYSVALLNYSLRSVFLFRPSDDGTAWQVHRWDSPWFRNPYPQARPE